MGSIIGQKIDYNGEGALRGQRHIPKQTLTQASPPGFFVNMCKREAEAPGKLGGEKGKEREGSVFGTTNFPTAE